MKRSYDSGGTAKLTHGNLRFDACADRLSPSMPTPDAVEIRRLDGPAARAHLDGLAGVLRDCVEGGASVGYMAPFSDDDARVAFEGFVSDAERGRRLIVAAFDEGQVVGTVQVVLALMPNQPHRGEIAKLLVLRSARRRGIARRLMERAEAEALAERKTLLVLDAVTGDPAERLYEGMGWNRVGIVPGFALYPDGRPCSTTYLWKALEPSRP
jgi:GNAT superfamily N-acetyltransferase